MSESHAQLESIAASVAGAARDGEQVEAYVVRSRETEIKVYGAEVESLKSALTARGLKVDALEIEEDRT